MAIETFSFVLLGQNELLIIGTSMMDKDTGQPLATVTASDELHGQR